MIRKGIRPVYVFDGKPPKLKKKKVLNKRKKARNLAEELLEKRLLEEKLIEEKVIFLPESTKFTKWCICQEGIVFDSQEDRATNVFGRGA